MVSSHQENLTGRKYNVEEQLQGGEHYNLREKEAAGKTLNT